jgi:hypothetical protein
MTESNTNTEAQVQPSYLDLLALSGLAPERYNALSEREKAEWVRAWHAKKAGLHG